MKQNLWFESLYIWTNEMPSAFFAKQRPASNETTYMNDCILKRLMLFIGSCQDKSFVLVLNY